MLSLNAKRRLIGILTILFLASLIAIAYFETVGH